ncbi:Premnaspirodiene oxygenase [Linum grandiflorum]
MAFLITTNTAAAGNQHLSASPLFLPLLTTLSIIIIIIIVIILCPTLIPRLIITGSHGSNHSPPGPWRLPVIGNLHQLISILPHRRLRQLALKYGPDIMHLQLGELSHIVISSAPAARQVMKTHEVVFASRPSLLGADIIVYAGNDLAFTAYTERYKQLRKICVVELLGAHRVRGFRSIREDEVGKLVSTFSRKAAEEEAVNISEEVFWLSTRVTSRAALGKARERDDGFLKIVSEVSDALGGFRVSDFFPSLKFIPLLTGYKAKLVRIHTKLDLMLDDIINEHKIERSNRQSQSVGVIAAGDNDDDDLVNVLLNLQEAGTQEFNLTVENIKAVILKSNRVLQKAQYEVRKVYAGKSTVDNEASIHELTYLDLVIKESLRLHPPLPLLLPRESREKVVINGYKIPDPERFLDRCSINNDNRAVDFEFIPFGSGRRMCPGMLYASAVVKVALANLLYHFDWKLPGGMKPQDLDMTKAFGVAVRRKYSLCLIPIRLMS